MTKKDFIIKKIGGGGYDYSFINSVAVIVDAHYDIYADAEKAAKRVAARNNDCQYAVYEMISIVEAKLPEAEVTKV